VEGGGGRTDGKLRRKAGRKGYQKEGRKEARKEARGERLRRKEGVKEGRQEASKQGRKEGVRAGGKEGRKERREGGERRIWMYQETTGIDRPNNGEEVSGEKSLPPGGSTVGGVHFSSEFWETLKAKMQHTLHHPPRETRLFNSLFHIHL
jgi:hypothetical protein